MLTMALDLAKQLSHAAAPAIHHGPIGDNARPHRVAQLFARE
jgi:hypothetical protein